MDCLQLGSLSVYRFMPAALKSFSGLRAAYTVQSLSSTLFKGLIGNSYAYILSSNLQIERPLYHYKSHCVHTI